MSIVIDKAVRDIEGSFHFHQSYEIIIASQGVAQIKGLELDEKVKRGDAVIIPPKFVHKFNPVCDDFTYYYIYGINEAYVNANEPIIISGDLIPDAIPLINLIYSNRYSVNQEYFSTLLNSLISLLSANVLGLSDIDLAINKIIKTVRRDFAKSSLCLSSLLQDSGYAEDYARAYFKKITGKTPNEFLTDLRITHAKKLITAFKNTLSLSSIAVSCGYDDYCYFSRKFKEVTGVSPNKFKRL